MVMKNHTSPSDDTEYHHAKQHKMLVAPGIAYRPFPPLIPTPPTDMDMKNKFQLGGESKGLKNVDNNDYHYIDQSSVSSSTSNTNLNNNSSKNSLVSMEGQERSSYKHNIAEDISKGTYQIGNDLQSETEQRIGNSTSFRNNMVLSPSSLSSTSSTFHDGTYSGNISRSGIRNHAGELGNSRSSPSKHFRFHSSSSTGSDYIDEYAILRREMESNELNLTSVLINPREDMATLDALFEEGYGGQEGSTDLSLIWNSNKNDSSSKLNYRRSSIQQDYENIKSNQTLTSKGYTTKKNKQSESTRRTLNSSYYQQSSSSLQSQISLENFDRETRKIKPLLEKYAENHPTFINSHQDRERNLIESEKGNHLNEDQLEYVENKIDTNKENNINVSNGLDNARTHGKDIQVFPKGEQRSNINLKTLQGKASERILHSTEEGVSHVLQNSNSPTEYTLSDNLSFNDSKISHEEYLEKLSVVPDMFLDEKYELNPTILESFLSRLEKNRGISEVDSLRQNPPNDEKMTFLAEEMGYLDIVEELLTRQISSRSAEFFKATANFHYLETQIKCSRDMTRKLRRDISLLTTQQKGALEIPKLATRKKNLRKLSNHVKIMEQVINAKETINKLLQIEDYMGALDFLEEGQTLIKDNLSNIHCFKKLSKQFSRYMDLIIELMGTSFINTSVKVEYKEDNNESNEDMDSLMRIIGEERHEEADGNDLLSSSSPQLTMRCRNQCLSEYSISLLKPRLDGLLRLYSLSKVLTRFKKSVLDSVKDVARIVVLQYLGFDEYTENSSVQDDMNDDKKNNDKADDNNILGLGKKGTLSGIDKAASMKNMSMDQKENSKSSSSGTDYKSRVQAMEPWSFLECLELAFEQLLVKIYRYKLVYDFLNSYLSKEVMSFQNRKEATAEQTPPSSNLNEDIGGMLSHHKNDLNMSTTSVSSVISNQHQKTPGSKQDKMKDFFDHRRKITGELDAKTTRNSTSTSISGTPRSTDTVNHNDAKSGSDYSHTTLTNIKNLFVTKEQTRNDESNLYLLELQGCRQQLDGLLHQLCETSQKSVAALIAVRHDTHAKLSNEDMKKLWSAAHNFISQLEAIVLGPEKLSTDKINLSETNKKLNEKLKFNSSYLRQTLLTQAQFFLRESQESNKLSLVTALDAEKWAQADVSVERQRQINSIFFELEAKDNKDASTSSIKKQISSSSTTAIYNLEGRDEKGKRKGKKEKKEVRDLILKGNSYKVVWSCLYLLEVLARYIELSYEFPDLTMDIVHRIADLLRLYNSKSRTLIVEAGATHSEHVKIKSITAKHLSLDFTSLEVITQIVPCIQAILIKFLKEREKPFLNDLSRSIDDCKNHQQQIINKFKDIVGALIDNKALQHDIKNYPWDGNVLHDSGNCDFFDDILKSVTVLHKVLSGNLPQGTLTIAFDSVNGLLIEKLTYLFFNEDPEDVIHINSTTGKTKVFNEIGHLVTSLGMLRGVNRDPLDKMKEIFQSKYQLNLLDQGGDLDQGEEVPEDEETSKGVTPKKLPLEEESEKVSPYKGDTNSDVFEKEKSGKNSSLKGETNSDV